MRILGGNILAKRPVFMVFNEKPFYKETIIDFEYFSGFALSQKQKSIDSLHNAFLQDNINKKVLEVSSKSKTDLGVQLSAFNLMIETKSKIKYSVEAAFQSSKVFENGGPYTDLLFKESKEAKKDFRLKNSGKLKRFQYGERAFDLIPKTYFYNWLYVHALDLNQDLVKQVINYDAFTDIEFNPTKSVNCQACAVAIYVSLFRNHLLNKALENEKSFLEVVYGSNNDTDKNSYEQMSLL